MSPLGLTPFQETFEWQVQVQMARWLSERSFASAQGDERSLNHFSEAPNGARVCGSEIPSLLLERRRRA